MEFWEQTCNCHFLSDSCSIVVKWAFQKQFQISTKVKWICMFHIGMRGFINKKLTICWSTEQVQILESKEFNLCFENKQKNNFLTSIFDRILSYIRIFLSTLFLTTFNSICYLSNYSIIFYNFFSLIFGNPANIDHLLCICMDYYWSGCHKWPGQSGSEDQ